MGKIEAFIADIDATIASTPKRTNIRRPHGHKRGVGTVEEQLRQKRRKHKPNRLADRIIRPDAEQYPKTEDKTIEMPPMERVVLASYNSTTRTEIDPSKALPIGRHQRIRTAFNDFERRKALRSSDKPIRTLPDWAKIK